jgi:hypothetical protein
VDKGLPGRLGLSKRASREGDFIFVGTRTRAKPYQMVMGETT